MYTLCYVKIRRIRIELVQVFTEYGIIHQPCREVVVQDIYFMDRVPEDHVPFRITVVPLIIIAGEKFPKKVKRVFIRAPDGAAGK